MASKSNVHSSQPYSNSFLPCRYISSIEACWRIFGHDLHEQWPPVLPLPIHCKGQQEVEFDADDDINQVIERAGRTPLTAWFLACQKVVPAEGPDTARGKTANDFLYSQKPEFFIYNRAQWCTCERGTQLGRVRMTNPGE